MGLRREGGVVGAVQVLVRVWVQVAGRTLAAGRVWMGMVREMRVIGEMVARRRVGMGQTRCVRSGLLLRGTSQLVCLALACLRRSCVTRMTGRGWAT